MERSQTLSAVELELGSAHEASGERCRSRGRRVRGHYEERTRTADARSGGVPSVDRLRGEADRGRWHRGGGVRRSRGARPVQHAVERPAGRWSRSAHGARTDQRPCPRRGRAEPPPRSDIRLTRHRDASIHRDFRRPQTAGRRSPPPSMSASRGAWSSIEGRPRYPTPYVVMIAVGVRSGPTLLTGRTFAKATDGASTRDRTDWPKFDRLTLPLVSTW